MSESVDVLSARGILFDIQSMSALAKEIGSLNMSKLSVTAGPASQAEASKSSIANVAMNSLTSADNAYKCEYGQDIWKSLLQQEAEKPPIHLQSPQLEFRAALIQRLRDVTKELGLTMATLHTAIAQLDLFMDAHRLRADRLVHIALACLSIAAKSEEKFNRAPTLKILTKVSGTHLCAKTFRQLEWMVGQHVKWRLLAPTVVTFASLLARFLVTAEDLTTRRPEFVRRFKRDGMRLIDAYLDLTLADVRLKVVETADVACACVSCARFDIGLSAWTSALAAYSGRGYGTVAPIARRLQRMMQIVRSKATQKTVADPGYGSARTSYTSTGNQISPAASSCSSTSSSSYQHRDLEQTGHLVLDMSDSNPPPPPTDRHRHLERTGHLVLDMSDSNPPPPPTDRHRHLEQTGHLVLDMSDSNPPPPPTDRHRHLEQTGHLVLDMSDSNPPPPPTDRHRHLEQTGHLVLDMSDSNPPPPPTDRHRHLEQTGHLVLDMSDSNPPPPPTDRHRHLEQTGHLVLDMSDSNPPPPPTDRHRHLEQTGHLVLDMSDSNPPPPPTDRYNRSNIMLKANLDAVPAMTGVAVKRDIDEKIEFENKRYRRE